MTSDFDNPQAPPPEGVPLRDYFAACALNGLLGANPQIVSQRAVSSEEFVRAIAKTAYQIADAMLKARETP